MIQKNQLDNGEHRVQPRDPDKVVRDLPRRKPTGGDLQKVIFPQLADVGKGEDDRVTQATDKVLSSWDGF